MNNNQAIIFCLTMIWLLVIPVLFLNFIFVSFQFAFLIIQILFIHKERKRLDEELEELERKLRRGLKKNGKK